MGVDSQRSQNFELEQVTAIVDIYPKSCKAFPGYDLNIGKDRWEISYGFEVALISLKHFSKTIFTCLTCLEMLAQSFILVWSPVTNLLSGYFLDLYYNVDCYRLDLLDCWKAFNYNPVLARNLPYSRNQKKLFILTRFVINAYVVIDHPNLVFPSQFCPQARVVFEASKITSTTDLGIKHETIYNSP